MARSVPIQVLPGCRGRVPVGELRRVARHVLDAETVAPAVEVEVVLADAETVRELNRLYRGRDESTDVLSFAEWESATQPEPVQGPGARPSSASGRADPPAFVAAPDEAPSLGEVVICVPFVEAQAKAHDLPIAGQIAHLLVHGLLHLIGYDHEASAAEATRQQEREEVLLAELGYDGLYEHGH